MSFDTVIRNGIVVDGTGLGSVPCRRRHRRRADREDRPHRGARGDRHRRRRSRRHAGVHRRAHAHGRAGVLGPARHELVLARRDHGGHGALRLHARTGRDDAHELVVRNLERAEDIARRRARRGDRVDAGPTSPDTSTRSTGSRRASTTLPTSATPPCAPTSWARGPSKSRPPTTTWPRWCRARPRLRAGAFGFTTSRTVHHQTSDDKPVASRTRRGTRCARWSTSSASCGAGIFQMVDRPGGARRRSRPQARRPRAPDRRPGRDHRR